MTQIFLLSGRVTHVGKTLLYEQAMMCTLQESKERLDWLGPFLELLRRWRQLHTPELGCGRWATGTRQGRKVEVVTVLRIPLCISFWHSAKLASVMVAKLMIFTLQFPVVPPICLVRSLTRHHQQTQSFLCKHWLLNPWSILKHNLQTPSCHLE